jgi:hypothetical protein
MSRRKILPVDDRWNLKYVRKATPQIRVGTTLTDQVEPVMVVTIDDCKWLVTDRIAARAAMPRSADHGAWPANNVSLINDAAPRAHE